MIDAGIAQRITMLGPWFHNLHLPDGSQTAPDHALGDFPSFKWKEIEPYLPSDLSGMKVLDIGCNAGFYNFELAKRGAQVTALDVDEHYLKQARWVAQVLELEDRVEFRHQGVYQLVYDHHQYDLVWFMGVFNHLRHPLLALDIIRQRCRGQMIFQTMTMPDEANLDVEENYPLDQREILAEQGWPKMAFIERRLADDPTNWWAPNHAAVTAMLRSSGFENIQRIAHEIYSCEAAAPQPLAIDELEGTSINVIY